jgi:hypothetical protein
MMPYIPQADRERLYHVELVEPATPGDLNYAITQLCVDYLGPNPNYARLNEITGALECAKLEFYRRMVAPYESTKLAINGDVYP